MYTLVILPHLDDEFALSPVLYDIHLKSKGSFKIIFCAERNKNSKKNRIKRRKETINSMKFFNIDVEDIIFLNDKIFVEDLKLINSCAKIYDYLTNFYLKHSINKIYTLNLEGGHPDHDALAILIDNFSKEFSIKKYFFPAYNHGKTFLFIPLRVLKPLNSQISKIKKKKINSFKWFTSLYVAFQYKSEAKAFLKLLPFLFINSLFSREIYISNRINIESIDWDKSLTHKIYGVDIVNLKKIINKKNALIYNSK